MIHICFGLHDFDGKYSKFVGTALASVLANTKAEVTAHILHDNSLTEDNRKKFSELATKYNQIVEFHNVEELCPDEMTFLRKTLPDKIKSRFSIATFYRLLIKKIVDAEKAIYLDADTIVNLDIEDLWQQDLKDYPLAAVPEIEAALNRMDKNKFVLNKGMDKNKFVLNKGIVKADNYFNAGVMILDLAKLDENFFKEGVQWLAENPDCESVDQDILNVFFSENYFKLAQKFNSLVESNRTWNLPVAKKIYHYMNRCLGLNLNDEYNRLFMENFALTSWLNANLIGRFGTAIRKSHEQDLIFTQWLMKLQNEHRRAFFLYRDDLQTIKDIFNIGYGEPIIEIRDENSLEELVSKMRELHKRKVFFLFYSKYDLLKKVLSGYGFEEFRDFADGYIFMTAAQGGHALPEYDFIRAM